MQTSDIDFIFARGIDFHSDVIQAGRSCGKLVHGVEQTYTNTTHTKIII